MLPRSPVPCVRNVPVQDTVPLLKKAMPVARLMVKVTPLFIVIWPPDSTITSSTVTAAVTVTVWPSRIVMAPCTLVGVTVADSQVEPSSEHSNVDVLFQLPDAAERNCVVAPFAQAGEAFKPCGLDKRSAASSAIAVALTRTNLAFILTSCGHNASRAIP